MIHLLLVVIDVSYMSSSNKRFMREAIYITYLRLSSTIDGIKYRNAQVYPYFDALFGEEYYE